jgi:uncharacterized integral membrane protein
MALVAFALGAIVGMAVLIFAFENMEPVTLRYLSTWQTPPMPLFSVIIGAVGMGVVIAGLFGAAAYLRARRTIRQQRRQLAELQAEVHRLRTLPLDAPVSAPLPVGPSSADGPAGERSSR